MLEEADVAEAARPAPAAKKSRTTAQQNVVDRRKAVCHKRSAGVTNPLTDDVMLKRPHVVAKMIDMHCDVASG